MPKREKTPPPPDDEPKYLTVVYPFPPHANMELASDQKEFTYWIASCTGKEPILAFFHKPKSPNMIIIEISRDYPHFDRILGEHRWSEVFQNPLPENKDRVSKIFYCKHSTGREVQKNGWKRIDVQERWFNEWNPINKLVTYPYPATHYCVVPPEDATNEPLCRPLPVKDFKPPPKPVINIPPVGAPGWQEARKLAAAASAWQKGPPSSRGSKNNAKGASPASSAAQRPNAWAKKPSPSVLAAPAPQSAAPPGLAHPSSAAFSSAWTSSRSAGSSAWTATSAPSRTSSAAGSSSDGGSVGRTPTGSVFPGADDDDLASMMEAHMHGTISEWGSDAWTTGQYAYDEPAPAGEGEGEPEEPQNLWADLPEEPKPQVILCSVHGTLCKKGICREYSRQLREAERRKNDAEKATKKADRRANKRKGKGPATPTESTPAPQAAPTAQQQAEDAIQFTVPRQRPAHLQRAAAPSTTSEPIPAAAENTRTSQTPRARPAHLTAGAEGGARVARGRKAAAGMGAASPGPAADANANGWGAPGTRPEDGVPEWGAAPAETSTKPALKPTTPKPATPKPATPTAAKDAGAQKKSWADMMEDDDARSSTDRSTNGGWGRMPPAAW